LQSASTNDSAFLLATNESGAKQKPILTYVRFPRLAPDASFPALGTSCKFSRAWHHHPMLPRLQNL